MSDFLEGLLEAITSSFTTLGKAVISFLREGFIRLFCEYTEANNVLTITGISPIAYFVFILMGISLVLGLVYFLVNMMRRSK